MHLGIYVKFSATRGHQINVIWLVGGGCVAAQTNFVVTEFPVEFVRTAISRIFTTFLFLFIALMLNDAQLLIIISNPNRIRRAGYRLKHQFIIIDQFASDRDYCTYLLDPYWALICFPILTSPLKWTVFWAALDLISPFWFKLIFLLIWAGEAGFCPVGLNPVQAYANLKTKPVLPRHSEQKMVHMWHKAAA